MLIRGHRGPPCVWLTPQTAGYLSQVEEGGVQDVWLPSSRSFYICSANCDHQFKNPHDYSEHMLVSSHSIHYLCVEVIFTCIFKGATLSALSEFYLNGTSGPWHGQVDWIMPGMNPISLTTKVDLGQKWPLLGLWDGVLEPSSHFSEEAILPSGCRPLEIYLLEFLSGLFNHQEKTEWKKPTCRRS